MSKYLIIFLVTSLFFFRKFYRGNLCHFGPAKPNWWALKLSETAVLAEVESRIQGSRPRPRTQKNFEAKVKDTGAQVTVSLIANTYCPFNSWTWLVINGNYILFTKLPWPGDSEGSIRSSSQAATCPPVYHTRRRLHTVSLIAERQAEKLRTPFFIAFGMIRPVLEPEFTASVANALSTRPLIS